MRFSLVAAFGFFAVVLTLQAQTPTEGPTAPAGWKVVQSGDTTYQFFMPAKTTRAGSRTKTVKTAKFSGTAQVNYALTKDGTQYAVEALNLSGPALKGLKIGEIYDLMIEAAKENGAMVSDPEEIAAGTQKGREITVTKGADVRREAIFVVQNRLISLSVSSKNKAKTTSDEATAFLKSLSLLSKEAAPAEKKEPTK
jgi:hypothetical protein